MLDTTETYRSILGGPHYKEVALDISGVKYAETNIVSAYIPPVGLYEKFGIGNCVSRELDFEVFPIGVIPRQAKINAKIRLVGLDTTSEWIPQGEFWISTRRKNKMTGSLVIVAFDAMLKAEETWLTSDYDGAEWPMTEQEAAEDIAKRMGVELDPRNELRNRHPVDYPVDENGDMSMREVLSGIAVSNAGNWIISNEGKLRLVPAALKIEETNHLVTEDGEYIMIGGVKINV